MLYSGERLHPDDLHATAETWLHLLLQLVSGCLGSAALSQRGQRAHGQRALFLSVRL